MSRIYRQLPAKGTRLGIVYSGGLDTRCAVAWLAEQGMDVYAYTADLAQPDEANPADIPPTALHHAAWPRGHHHGDRARDGRRRCPRVRRRLDAQGQRHPALLSLRHPRRSDA